MDQQESLRNAAANVLGYKQRGAIKFIRSWGRVKGVWVMGFPGNTSREDFVAMFCQMEKREDLVQRVVLRQYTISDSASGKGYDVLFK